MDIKIMFDKFVYNFILSDVGKVIWDNLNDPEEWSIYEYRIEHKKTGINLWTGNGGFWFDGYYLNHTIPTPSLGLIERHFLYRKAMKMRNKSWFVGNRKVIRAFAEADKKN